MNFLPSALIRSLQQVQGFNEETFKAVHEQGGQVTSVRLNPHKIFNNQLSIFNAQLEKVKWSSTGYYLAERPSFTSDPLFHAGAYYVQEASSMFLEEALKQATDLSQPIKVLDLCAAPGGKSTLIQSVISKESLLVSNEVIKTRVNILTENMTKWGAANVIVTNSDPKDFQRLPNYFDVIVVDAPCSGSGLFRKHPEAISEWNENNVQLCSQRQQRILADVMPALKEGGILIYSTCSYSQQEDEEIADWLTEEFNVVPVKLKVGEDSGIIETGSAKYNSPGYRFYPDKVRGEGFFIAAFKKSLAGEGEYERRKYPSALPRSKKETAAVTAKELSVLRSFIDPVDDLVFIKQQDDILAVPANSAGDLALIRSALYIKKTGIKTGSIIRDELVPAHELAVSDRISNAVIRFEVDRKTAMQYLRREEIIIDTDHRGWALITFQQLPLGWIKLLVNRINNYYPPAWRILNK